MRRWRINGYRYLIVIPAAKYDLETIVLRSSGLIVKDFNILSSFTMELASALSDLHKVGFIHGDIKPLNVMKIEDHLKLIDFDSSYRIKLDYAAKKYTIVQIISHQNLYTKRMMNIL